MMSSESVPRDRMRVSKSFKDGGSKKNPMTFSLNDLFIFKKPSQLITSNALIPCSIFSLIVETSIP
jgi:hypothetical protein